jgi:hypothetical protein
MTSQATSEPKVKPQSDALLAQAIRQEQLALDAQLRGMNRNQVLTLDAAQRLRWFYLLQLRHAELERVTSDLMELLEPNNETNIISIIGMTGIGKTTLASSLMNSLSARFFGNTKTHEVPVIYVRAPSNGDKSLSWKTLYQRALNAGHEVLVDKKCATEFTETHARIRESSRASLAGLRESLEHLLKHRNVRLFIIDEALHLLRFAAYEAVMDTLKSLADAHATKLLLLGSYDIAELMTQYGQVARRSEIIHYKRYRVGDKAGGKPATKEFEHAVTKLQSVWPCESMPNLVAISDVLFSASLGSVGLLKAILLRAAALQMGVTSETWKAPMLVKAVKSRKLLRKIEQETSAGEAVLEGACYGESMLASEAEFKALVARMGEATPHA